MPAAEHACKWSSAHSLTCTQCATPAPQACKRKLEQAQSDNAAINKELLTVRLALQAVAAADGAAAAAVGACSSAAWGDSGAGGTSSGVAARMSSAYGGLGAGAAQQQHRSRPTISGAGGGAAAAVAAPAAAVPAARANSSILASPLHAGSLIHSAGRLSSLPNALSVELGSSIARVAADGGHTLSTSSAQHNAPQTLGQRLALGRCDGIDG
jgi:hypothetical protein